MTEPFLATLVLSERQHHALLHLKAAGRLTNTDYQRVTGTTKKTATRDLENLIARGVLDRVGKTGRGTYYVLARKGTQRGQRGTEGGGSALRKPPPPSVYIHVRKELPMACRSKILGALLLISPFLTGGRLLALEGMAVAPGEPASWTFYVENDSFLSTDRYYTNGIRLTQSYGADGLPHWAHTTRWMEHLVKRLPRPCAPGWNDGSCSDYEAAWTFGQNLYTPDDIRTSRLIRGQRPYGAWLYYGNVLTVSKGNEQQSLEIDVGAVGGSWAFGEDVQRGWHSFLRSAGNSDLPPDPKGWGNQIKNQPGLQLIYQDRWRLKDFSTESGVRYFDLVPAVSVGLGTVNVQGSVGAMARLGYNLHNEFPEIIPPAPPPAAPPALAQASGRRPAPFLRPAPAPPGRRWEAYLFARADQRYVAYSAFLDGNLRIFGRSPSVEKDPLVTDLQAGAVLGYAHWRASVTYVDRSPEFRGQRGHQNFLSFTLLHRR
ncbi:MAG TPA: lipid A-modifier LpxR family protein [Thermoanaerobaculia bacterium]|nr:lipid A-modifier LpxR family protein [Thermoanaerobaculia bacterium]